MNQTESHYTVLNTNGDCITARIGDVGAEMEGMKHYFLSQLEIASDMGNLALDASAPTIVVSDGAVELIRTMQCWTRVQIAAYMQQVHRHPVVTVVNVDMRPGPDGKTVFKHPYQLIRRLSGDVHYIVNLSCEREHLHSSLTAMQKVTGMYSQELSAEDFKTNAAPATFSLNVGVEREGNLSRDDYNMISALHSHLSESGSPASYHPNPDNQKSGRAVPLFGAYSSGTSPVNVLMQTGKLMPGIVDLALTNKQSGE